MAVEIELKFVAQDVAVFEEMKKESNDWTAYQMATTYYDTPDAKMGKLHWTLRRRFENGVSVCTVKTPHAGGGRNEFELECDDINVAIPRLCEMGAPKELLLITADGIEEVCAARFDRLAGKVFLGDTEVELALDKGVLIGGGKEQPFVEVEVELKAGDVNAAQNYALALAAKHGLKPESKSKYKRALMLAGKA